MSDQPPVPATSSAFERIKRVRLAGDESWSARDLARALEYPEFRRFLPLIEKAIEACVKSPPQVEDHFEQNLEMVCIRSDAQRPVEARNNQ